MLLTMGGVQMQMIAHGYLVYDITSSAFLLVVVNSGFALPMLSLSLFGGVLADRIDRKRIIQLGQISSGATALLIGLAITTGTVTWVHLFLTSMLQRVVFVFFMPARQAIIPQIVGEDMLTNAMALNAAAMSTSTLVAPAIAGSLYALIGLEAVYYVIAGMGVAAVVVTSFIHNPSKAPLKASAAMMGDIIVGLSYSTNSRFLEVEIKRKCQRPSRCELRTY
jgi:MFS family permease